MAGDLNLMPVGYVAQLTTEPYVPVMERGPLDTAYSEMLRLLEVTRQQEAKLAALRKDAELLAWVLAHPETAAEELDDAAAGEGSARANLERRRGALARRGDR